MDINEEIEQIILRAIIRYGLNAIPKDYSFIIKYGLKDLYFLGIELNIKGIKIKDIKKIISMKIERYLKPSDFENLIELYKRFGKPRTISELHNNERYYKIFYKMMKNNGK